MTKEEKIIDLADKTWLKYYTYIVRLKYGVKVNSNLKNLLPNDLIDLQEFFDLVAHQQFKPARKLMRNLDTFVREYIPASIYNFLEELE